ncbi:hypothetical protein H6G00_05085 [Leptolyngbya sp. FACHB-541]|uniref:hypothetical protein n=1 Tax=Leptolyngbya sp. FACHB-541 TaxID=2692810 RepID=UPI0016838BF9|nr:hypothetical protein [Leptolyngbya sp. FACHB-541]MBD1995990.1 hypothetical protein [Leptolyngbya sp. FACHB-541]
MAGENERPDRYRNREFEKLKEERRERQGFNSTGKSKDDLRFGTYVSNAGNLMEGAKFQADKDTEKGRSQAHKQLDGASKSLEEARRIVHEDVEKRGGGGLLGFLGLSTENSSERRTSSNSDNSNTSKSEPSSSSDSDQPGGLLGFLGLNFDNPSNNKPDRTEKSEPSSSSDSDQPGGLLGFLGLNFDNPSNRK